MRIVEFDTTCAYQWEEEKGQRFLKPQQFAGTLIDLEPRRTMWLQEGPQASHRKSQISVVNILGDYAKPTPPDFWTTLRK